MNPLRHFITKKRISLIIFTTIIYCIFTGAYPATNTTFAQNSCVQTANLSNDSRCLYVMNGNVYQKGSKASPHQGHPCGMDVSSIIPGFHIADIAKYLDPNLVGPVCAQQTQTDTPTPQPTTTSTSLPASSQQNVQSTSLAQNASSNELLQNNTPGTPATEIVYVYLPKPTQQIVYVTATIRPNETMYTGQKIAINGTPPGTASWSIFALPIGLILLGLLL